MLRLALTLVLLIASLVAPRAQETSEWVARQVRERNTGRDSRAELRMRLYDRQGRVRERALTLLRLRGEKGSGDKMLLRFTYPNDIRNTAFLVWEHRGAQDDERFLYLPALGRVRRIAGQEKQESFVGSDLSYEDIGGRDIDEYTYAFTVENASWLGPDGSRHPAWLLESRAKDQNVELPRSVSFVLKEKFIIAAADVFNRRNERVKHFEARKLDQIEGIWTVMDLVMTNERDNTRTELTTTSIDYNVGLKDSDFSQRQLESTSR